MLQKFAPAPGENYNVAVEGQICNSACDCCCAGILLQVGHSKMISIKMDMMSALLSLKDVIIVHLGIS